MEMDLQKTKGARTRAPGKNDDDSGYYVAACGTASDSNPRDSSPDKVNGGSPNTFPPHHDGSPLSPPSNTFPNHLTLSEEAMFVPANMGLGSWEIRLLCSAEHMPPLTKNTLRELDLDHIMRNINLRVDVNFDRDLYFRPVDGEKGLAKRRLAEEYWEAMAIEISIYAFCASNDVSQASATCWSQQRFEPRLPAMLETLKEVLKTLVPERDHLSVMQNLDVPFLMQQIRKAVLDLPALSEWLATLLKTHCAPMRDQWADQMVEEITVGCASQDMHKVVQGLRTLFGILEAMKLDVANHQIRAFRVILIDDTVHFLQDYFLRRIAQNSTNVDRSRSWYLNLRRQGRFNNRSDPGYDNFEPVSVLFSGLFALLLPFNPPRGFPETFKFDSDRLWQLRADIQDLIRLEICCHVFRDMASRHGRRSSLSSGVYFSLQSRIWPILEDSDISATENHRWQSNTNRIALEIARAVSAVHGCNNNQNLDAGVVLVIEETLASCFAPGSSQFRRFQRSVQKRLEATTFAFAQAYLQMTPLEICEAQRTRQLQSHVPEPQCTDLERIARRLAHIGVLHWKVWAPLLYAREDVVKTPATAEFGSELADSDREDAAKLRFG